MVAFNKMFVMVPVMLAARKLDGEDPNVVYWLRVAYFSVQSVIILVVAYTYIQATTVASQPGNDRVVYIPPAASVCLKCHCCSREVLFFLMFSDPHLSFSSFLAVCGSECQEKVHRNRLQQAHSHNGTWSLGEYLVWDYSYGRIALLQGHGHWFSHSEHHGTL